MGNHESRELQEQRNYAHNMYQQNTLLHRQNEQYIELIKYQTTMICTILAVLVPLVVFCFIWLFRYADSRRTQSETKTAEEKQRVEEVYRAELEKVERRRRTLESNLHEEEKRNIELTYEMQLQKVRSQLEELRQTVNTLSGGTNHEMNKSVIMETNNNRITEELSDLDMLSKSKSTEENGSGPISLPATVRTCSMHPD